ncbi:MAG: hypothetical protein R3B70_04525 [Polyangiaceae bacterium]
MFNKIAKAIGALIIGACATALKNFISEKVKQGLNALWNRFGPGAAWA